MQCYVCSAAPGPGGTQYGVRDAVGICHACGIGLCAVHGRGSAPSDLRCCCPEHRTADLTRPPRTTRTATQAPLDAAAV